MRSRQTLTIALLLLSAGGQSVQADLPASLSCGPQVVRYLQPDSLRQDFLDKAETELAEQAISLELSQFAYFLKFEFERQKLGALTDESKKSACRETAAAIYDELARVFITRLAQLLESRQVTRFYNEVQIVLSPRPGAAERQDLMRLGLDALLTQYLELIHSTLTNGLQNTPWKNLASLAVQTVPWNEEWSRLVGRDLPAAVHFESDRIALRPLDFTPLELQIFLFHELSHLADPNFSEERLWVNEVFAWRQTLAFLDYLETVKKLPLPPVFLSVRKGVQLHGLETWVTMVFKMQHGQPVR